MDKVAVAPASTPGSFTDEGAPPPGMVRSAHRPDGDVPADAAGPADQAATRPERDALGEIDVSDDVLWGAQTQRALRHFPDTEDRMPAPLIEALALVKRTAARANAALGMLDAPQAEAIARAAEEVMTGQHRQAFPLSVWQSGSGTQTHMNMNEVLANRASELLGGGRGEARTVHPNDHVNLGQSSNDVMPTALHIAVLRFSRDDLMPAIDGLRYTLDTHAAAFESIIKVGRTHLQDAVPLTLGQEVSAWASQLEQAQQGWLRQLDPVHELAIGGTAVGTGLNTHPRFAQHMVEALGHATDLPLRQATNPFAAQSAHDALVGAHGALRTLAVALIKIANDLRWLASGPRCGLGELVLPVNEPGSSIMPGKVNPGQCEALIMVAGQVLGNDVAVGFAGTSGHFQLNTALPLFAHNLMQSLRLLSDAIRSFDLHCARGIEPDRARMAEHLSRTLMLVTALVPHVGHDRAAQIAQHAQTQGVTLREAALAIGTITADEFDAWVQPSLMTDPGRSALS